MPLSCRLEAFGFALIATVLVITPLGLIISYVDNNYYIVMPDWTIKFSVLLCFAVLFGFWKKFKLSCHEKWIKETECLCVHKMSSDRNHKVIKESAPHKLNIISKTKSIVLYFLGILIFIISYVLKAPSNATFGYHFVSVVAPILSYSIILFVISYLITLFFKKIHRLKMFSWLFLSATLLALLASLFRLFVLSSVHDLEKYPEWIFNDNFSYKTAVLSELMIGDSIEKIPKHKIVKENELGWKTFSNGARFRVENDIIIALGMSHDLKDKLNIRSESDIEKLFGNPDEINPMEIGSSVLLKSYVYREKGVSVIWSQNRLIMIQIMDFSTKYEVEVDKTSNKEFKNEEYYLNQGVAYYELGKYQEAVDAYKQAIRIKPDDPYAHHGLGLTYGKLGKYQEALDAFNQAIRIKPDDAELNYNLGASYGRLDKWKEAVDAFNQAIRIKPDYADAHYTLGVSYDELGKHQESVGAYKEAIRIKPDYARAYLFLANAYDKLDKHEESADTLKQAIRIKPDYAMAHFGLGVVYINKNDRGSAIDEYKILKDLDKELANKLYNLIYK